MKTIEPSFSNSDRFIQCSWPWGKPELKEVGDKTKANHGTAFHEYLAFRLRGKDHEPAFNTTTEAREHVDEVFPFLRNWLTKGNPYSCNFLKIPPAKHRGIETSIALSLYEGRARWCAPPDADHVYTDRLPNELPGTIDFWSYANGTLLVMDHKTGREPPSPYASGQLRSAAIALIDILKLKDPTIVLAIFHATKDGIPTVFHEEIDIFELAKHRDALKDAHRRRGSGLMGMGPECNYCPVRLDCPTQTSALVQLGVKQGEITKERAAAIHQSLAVYRGLADDLDDRIRAVINAQGAAIRPDGKILDFVPRTYTNLSQASIRRALPKDKAEELIAMLKKSGCIEEGERMELRAVNDR